MNKVISFTAILPDQEELSNELIIYKKIIDDFIENINKIITIMKNNSLWIE